MYNSSDKSNGEVSEALFEQEFEEFNGQTKLSPLYANCFDAFEVIFAFLPQKDLVNSISLVCKNFRMMIIEKVGLDVFMTSQSLISWKMEI